MAPSTWNQSPSRSHRSASAARSSVAPVLMVAALPITQNGRAPAARSAAIMRPRAATSISKAPLTGTLRSDCAPSPSASIDFCTQLWTSTDAYASSRCGDEATPSLRMSRSDSELRATVSPTKFAIEPPLTSRPLAAAGKPTISLHQSTTCASTWLATWLPPPRLGLTMAARKSATAAVGVPLPMNQAQKRGCMLPTGYGSTSSWKSAYAASAPSGSRGALPFRRARTVSGTGCQTGRSRTVCR